MDWAPCQKPSCWGLVLANKMQKAPDLSWRDVVSEVYSRVDDLGGGYQIGRNGWGNLPKNQKPSHQHSVLANETQGALDLDWGCVVEEGHIGVEGLGGGEQVADKGGGYLVKIQNRAAGAQFWLEKHGGWLRCIRAGFLR